MRRLQTNVAPGTNITGEQRNIPLPNPVLWHIGSSFHNLWYKIHGYYMYIKKTTALRTARRKTTVKNVHMRSLQTCVAPSTNRTGNEMREIVSLPNLSPQYGAAYLLSATYGKKSTGIIKTSSLRTARGTTTLKKITNAKAKNIRSVEHKSYRQEENMSLRAHGALTSPAQPWYYFFY
jgi:hypothetical protein